MKSTLSVLFCVITGLSLSAAEYAWSFQAGGKKHDKARALAVGQDGSVYLTGEFSEKAKFGGKELVSSGDLDCFLAKLDRHGKLQWTHPIGGKKIERGYSVAVDTDGNSYLTGHFQSESLNIGSTTLQNRGDYDIFIAKFDASGQPVWATSAGGAAYDFGHGIALDHQGHVYVSGSLRKAGWFGDTPISETDLAGPFVAKYSTDGKLVWTRLMTGRGGGSAHEIAARDGHLYVGGYVSGKLSFARHAFGTSKGTDIFAARLDGDGNLSWKFQAGGRSDGLVSGIVADASGNCYLAGMFKATALFGTQQFTSAGGHDLYLAKLNNAGKPEWAFHAGGPKTDYGLGLAVDPAGNPIITGETTGAVRFGSKLLKPIGNRDIYTAKFQPDGKLKWIMHTGGSLNGLSYTAGSSEHGTVFAGAFSGKLKIGGKELTSSGSNDILVAQIVD